MTRESSPPEAVAARRRISCPGLAQKRNSASSKPFAERDSGTAGRETSSTRNFAPGKATCDSSFSTAGPIRFAPSPRFLPSSDAARTPSSSSARTCSRNRFSSSSAPSSLSRSARIVARAATSPGTSVPYFRFRRRISLSLSSTRPIASADRSTPADSAASSRATSCASIWIDRTRSTRPAILGSTAAASLSLATAKDREDAEECSEEERASSAARRASVSFEAFRKTRRSAASFSSSAGSRAARESSRIWKSRCSPRSRAFAPRDAASSAFRRRAERRR